MLFTVAWKNIWRNPQRSLVMVLAVMVGIWSLLFMLGWMEGVTKSYIELTIQRRTAHLQIHTQEFKDTGDPVGFFDSRPIDNILNGDSQVKVFGARTKVSSMVSSPSANRGILWVGIDTLVEKQISGMDGWVTEGSFFKSVKRNPLLVSDRTAEKLGVGLHSKVVLNYQTAQGDISAASFRICGIFNTGDAGIDDSQVFGTIEDSRRLLGMESFESHEIAILLNDISNTDTTGAILSDNFKDLVIEGYMEIAPELELFANSIQLNALIMITIFMLALIFGIVNTMLMAVLERTRELGMLMAIGMAKLQVFTLVLLETILLSIIGLPLGILAGTATVEYLNRTGMNLSSYSEGLRQYGMAPIVYPEVSMDSIISVSVGIFITAVLAAVYPALKAIRLNPVEAMHKI